MAKADQKKAGFYGIKEFVDDVSKKVICDKGIDTKKAVVDACVRAVFEVITDRALMGEVVNVPNFGKFVTREVSARTFAFVPNSPIHAPAHKRLAYVPSIVLKQLLSGKR